MAFALPRNTLEKNTSPAITDQVVGKHLADAPSGLVDRYMYGGNYPMFAGQMWKEPNGNVHPAKNTAILPYSNPFQPTSGFNSTPGAIASAQSVTFGVDAFRGILEKAYLEIDITTAAADLTLHPFITWFSEFLVYVNDNQGQVVKLYCGNPNLEYYSYGMERSDEERLILEGPTNIDEPTFNGTPITAGTTLTYRFKIPGWWEVVPWPIDSVKRFNVKFTTFPGATIIQAGPGTSANITIDAWRLVLDTRVVSNEVYDALKIAWTTGLTVKWMEHVVEIQQKALTSGQNAVFDLNNVQGVTPQLDIISTYSSPAATTTQRIDTLDSFSNVLIQDSSGMALMGQSNIPVGFLQTHGIIENGLLSRMPSLATKRYIPIMFGEGGWVRWKRNHCALLGYQSLLRNRIIMLATETATRNIIFSAYRVIFLNFIPNGNTGQTTMEVVRF